MAYAEHDLSDAFEDGARLAGRKGLTRFTRYLDPAQAIQAAQIAKANGAAFASWGGHADAERVIGCFYPLGEEAPSHEEYPLACLHSRVQTKFSTITHRDLLGAFMALGLTRSCVGDIIISGSDVYLFATDQTADFISASMTSAGKNSLSFSIIEEAPVFPAPDGTAFSAVVSSLRLDAVLAAAYHLSRSEAADFIRGGLVKVNHMECERVDALLKENALLSLKGKGRVRLTAINGMTRKQRIGISLFRYE